MSYVANGRERLIRRADLPQPLPGAPSPLFVGDEHRVLLAYFAKDDDDVCDSEGVVEPQLIEPNAVDQLVAVCAMDYYAVQSEPFHWESLERHPLRDKGLRLCSVFELKASSWNAELAPPDKGLLNPRKFERWKHMMFVFHDSIFEVVCRNLRSQASRTGAREAILREFFQSR